jgi:hypothetical protein
MARNRNLQRADRDGSLVTCKTKQIHGRSHNELLDQFLQELNDDEPETRQKTSSENIEMEWIPGAPESQNPGGEDKEVAEAQLWLQAENENSNEAEEENEEIKNNDENEEDDGTVIYEEYEEEQEEEPGRFNEQASTIVGVTPRDPTTPSRNKRKDDSARFGWIAKAQNPKVQQTNKPPREGYLKGTRIYVDRVGVKSLRGVEMFFLTQCLYKWSKGVTIAEHRERCRLLCVGALEEPLRQLPFSAKRQIRTPLTLSNHHTAFFRLFYK